jgi:hypothetical protein
MSMHEKPEIARRGRRAQVYMSGELSTPTGETKVTIRDISASGAHIISEQPLGSASLVYLKRGTLCAAAHVAWVNGNEAGLRFERELSPLELKQSMPTAILRALDGDPPKD